MPPSSSDPKPDFTIDEPANLRLRLLHDNIASDPATYLQAVEDLVNPDDLSKVDDPRVPDNVHRAAALIVEVFRQRDDRDINFDSDTEASLDALPERRGLIAKLRASKSPPAKQGYGQAESANSNANRVRDNIRHLTLSHYIGLVLNAQEVNSEENADADTDSAAS